MASNKASEAPLLLLTNWQCTCLASFVGSGPSEIYFWRKNLFHFILRFSGGINRMKDTGIFLPNHNRKTISRTKEKRFIQSELSCQNESVNSQGVHVVVDTSSIFIHKSL